MASSLGIRIYFRLYGSPKEIDYWIPFDTNKSIATLTKEINLYRDQYFKMALACADTELKDSFLAAAAKKEGIILGFSIDYIYGIYN